MAVAEAGSRRYDRPLTEDERLRAKYAVSESFDLTRYVPPGPVVQNFILAQPLTKFVMGPVGGGKTVGCAFARIEAATRMPVCKDGVIRDKFIVVRDTFRLAEKTVLASWLQWFPKTYPGSTWTGGNDRPATHTLRWRMRNGRIVEATTEFLGLNGESIEDMMRGREISGGWVNEADTVDESVLRNLEQRTGRYPKRDQLLEPDAPRVRQVLGDFNAPSIDNWTYREFVENPKEDRRLFTQTSGRSVDAENLGALELDYYTKIVKNEPEWFVRRFVDNQFGYSRDGKPVYEAFDQNRHVSREPLVPDQNLPLLIGMDAGLTPAAVFLQPRPNGQLIVTDELYPGHGFGASRFGELVADMIARRYPRVPSIQAWCDPAAQYGADKEGGELAWMDTVGLILELPVLVPANGSNEIGLRIDAVTGELNRFIDGQTPRLLISRHCRMLIQGFASKYRFKKRKDNSGATYEPVPEKNDWSHPHDGLQYGVLGYRGRNAVVRQSAGPARQSSGGPSPWGSGAKAGGFDVHNV